MPEEEYVYTKQQEPAANPKSHKKLAIILVPIIILAAAFLILSSSGQLSQIIGIKDLNGNAENASSESSNSVQYAKPMYYCDSKNNTFCINMIDGCTDSVISQKMKYNITYDHGNFILSIDVKNDSSNCTIYYSISNVVSDSKSTTENAEKQREALKSINMTCRVPLINGKLASAALEKYCIGTYYEVSSYFSPA
jgi:hypothetical protein